MIDPTTLAAIEKRVLADSAEDYPVVAMATKHALALIAAAKECAEFAKTIKHVWYVLDGAGENCREGSYIWDLVAKVAKERADAQQANADLRRERSDWEASALNWSSRAGELTAHRDRLKAALEKITHKMGLVDMAESFGHSADMTPIHDIIEAALREQS